jgi:SAM-dependent methyltransferase
MRRTYALLYGLGLRPWDTPETPSPLAEYVATNRPGAAVDLGCGTGAQARYLAAHGWRVTGVAFVARAIDLAIQADPQAAVTWRVADVTRPSDVDPDGRLTGLCDLVLDNGCLHGLSENERAGWAATVGQLAAPGATLLVRAAPPRRGPGVGPAGIRESAMDELLDPDWSRTTRAAHGWHRYVRRDTT